MIEIRLKTTQELIADELSNIFKKYDCDWSCKIDICADILSIKITANDMHLDFEDMDVDNFRNYNGPVLYYIKKWFRFHFKEKDVRPRITESDLRAMEANLHLLEG